MSPSTSPSDVSGTAHTAPNDGGIEAAAGVGYAS